MEIVVNKNIGVLLKKEGSYGLFQFEFGKFVFNLNKVKKKDNGIPRKVQGNEKSLKME